MRTVVVVAVVVAGMILRPLPGLAKPTTCPGGRFVVQGGPLLPGAPGSQVDVVALGTSSADLGVGCGPSALQGTPKLRGRKAGTKVSVLWQNCAGFTGKVRLTGTIIDACGTLRAKLRAKGLKKPFTAAASTCGDGFVDASGGEGCEAGVGCDVGSTCTDQCACAGPCNPLGAPGAQGCTTGQKCTWVVVQDMPDSVGTVACVADGVKDLGDSCTQGAPGEATGFDTCKAGLICIGSTCRDVCGFDASPGAACATGFVCTRYSGVFANATDDPVAGACAPSCDPITQTVTGGGTCPAGQGCYLLTGSVETVAVCSQAGTVAPGALIVGAAFANSCVPGAQPRRRDMATQDVECGALCQITDVYQGVNEASEGGVTPYTCAAAGAALPSDPTNGESCRYYWLREPFASPGAYSNTVGWCFKHAAFQYDTDGDQTPDAPSPRCVTLTTGDLVLPIGDGNDALYFGCVAQPASLPAPLRREPRALLDRLAP